MTASISVVLLIFSSLLSAAFVITGVLTMRAIKDADEHDLSSR